MQNFESNNLSVLPHIGHAFFNRNGGVSSGVYESLNCSVNSKDDIKNVRRNLEVIKNYFDAKNILTLNQVHGSDSVWVDDDKTWDLLNAPKADAIICNKPNIVIGINTADCVPILIAHKAKPLIAAIHAGWKSALADIIIKTVKNMNVPSCDLVAAIGPAIAAESYEVGEDVKKQFGKDEFFYPAKIENKFLFDLPAFVMMKIQQAGINNTQHLNINTFSNDKFFSARRAKKEGLSDFGRQFSAIVIKSA